jgi:predicted metal-dependent phosphoesterase TrpH
VRPSTAQLILAPDAAIDLHIHTVHSDGDWTPEQLFDHLVGEAFSLVAIADHDRVETVMPLQQQAAEKQLPVLAAVEMTTLWKGEMTDVLCYGFDPQQNELDALARNVARRQQENTWQVYENLQRQGYITFPRQPEEQWHSELSAILEKPSAQQPHELAALLNRHGYVTGATSAGEILSKAGITFAASDMAAVVEAAHRSGTVCLIAHPGRGDGFTRFDVSLLDQLREEIPIDGLEVYHPAHTPEQINLYRDYAQKHHLLISSGSDSHGPKKKPIKYRAELSRDLLERVGIEIK